MFIYLYFETFVMWISDHNTHASLGNMSIHKNIEFYCLKIERQ